MPHEIVGREIDVVPSKASKHRVVIQTICDHAGS